MNSTGQRLCAYSGIVCLVMFLVGFWLVAGFVPPPSPKLTGEQLVQLFTEDRSRIRFGMIISLFAAALLASWAAAITVQMKRMEGRGTALAYTNLAVGALFVLEFIFSLIIWQSMTYRTRDPQVMLAMNDTAWFLFVCITSTPALQAVVIGLAIFGDKREKPIFPRWAGYLNFWVALLFLPGTIAVFFKDGPFAWNGLFTWYLPLGVFAIWMVTLCILTLKAITASEREPAPQSEVAALANQIQELRAELTELSAIQKEISR